MHYTLTRVNCQLDWQLYLAVRHHIWPAGAPARCVAWHVNFQHQHHSTVHSVLRQADYVLRQVVPVVAKIGCGIDKHKE